MEKENELARIYDLIEQFDFEDLPENEKSFILQQISIIEYNDMRSTIVDTKRLFSKYPDFEVEKGNFLLLKKTAMIPIELYKVAAAILLFIGIGVAISKFHPVNNKALLAMVDTVYIDRTDTMIIKITDTLELVNEKIVYKDIHTKKNFGDQTNNVILSESLPIDCSKNICPTDISLMSKLKTKGSFSNDTMLKDFIVTLN
jgi:hypothetical protein